MNMCWSSSVIHLYICRCACICVLACVCVDFILYYAVVYGCVCRYSSVEAFPYILAEKR